MLLIVSRGASPTSFFRAESVTATVMPLAAQASLAASLRHSCACARSKTQLNMIVAGPESRNIAAGRPGEVTNSSCDASLNTLQEKPKAHTAQKVLDHVFSPTQ